MTVKKDLKRRRRKKRQLYPPLPTSTPPSEPTSPATTPASTTPTTPAEPLPVERMELIPCPECGSKIDKTQIVCANCGHELPKCAICNLALDDDAPIETCPECGATGHRAHFREWVHVKGHCPICKKPISF